MSSFDKIIGYEAEKKELYQIIDMFKNREKYDKLGAKLPKGLLIYGNPGLGKTMLAETLTKECGVDTFVFKKNGDDDRSQLELSVQENYVRAELERYYYLAKKILLKNKDFYFKLVDALKKKDYLLFSEIQKIRKSSSIKMFYAC